ncbi:MAG: nucleoside triphosphate pyrophosphohydrolase [Clostridiales bacterium]|nr:nucleoside triphosphate pyrophosphohydrolase [Clostridiales bacterium]
MQTITIVILPAPGALTCAQKAALESGAPLFLQTDRHPSAEALVSLKRVSTSMDDLFDTAEDFDALNAAIAERLCEAGECVYVATGSVENSQLPAIEREANARGIAVSILPHLSAGDVAFPERPRAVSISAHDLPQQIDPERDCVVEEIDSRIAAGDAKLFLSEFFPDEYPVSLASIQTNGAYAVSDISLCDLDRQNAYDATTILYVPHCDYEARVRHGFDDVMRVVRRLRAPNGCPWDREQTHVSLKNALLEESYELIDAIDEDDDAHICEEMGDVLLQFALHAAIAEEQSAFTARDACTELVEKLIYRHPHVFGGIRVSGSDEVLKNWDALKMAQRNQNTQTEVLKSVPKSFPALLRSRKVQKKAADVGFDWSSAQEAFYKIAEETEELRQAMEQSGNVEEEMGDLLFAVVNVARLLKLEPEFLLQRAADKFISRFETMEFLALMQGRALKELSFEEQDKLWEEAKKCRITE